MKKLMLALLLVGLSSTHVSAERQDIEFTPGPRMIHAIERIAGSYAHLGRDLGLTAEQTDTIAGLVRRIKTEMWMKEAVLIGMFQEMEEKRRHGLLEDNAYRVANTLTGGIETDELNLFIETLTALRRVLTEDQQAKLRAASHPTMAFRLSQGFNTKIGLMSLGGIGRVYNDYRDELGLSETQAQAIHSLLETARREVLRLGTEIDLSRAESDELVMRPDVEVQVIRAKMQKTGETEGMLFNTLFAVSDQIDEQLTEEQRKKLAELKHNRQSRAAGREYRGHANAGHGHGERSSTVGFDYFLNQPGRLGLTSEQVAALVAAKNETRKAILIERAKLKGAELELLTLLRDRDSEKPAPEEEIATAVQGLEDIRSRITQAKVYGYLNARNILTREQRQRVHPPQMLEDGS